VKNIVFFVPFGFEIIEKYETVVIFKHRNQYGEFAPLPKCATVVIFKHRNQYVELGSTTRSLKPLKILCFSKFEFEIIEKHCVFNI